MGSYFRGENLSDFELDDINSGNDTPEKKTSSSSSQQIIQGAASSSSQQKTIEKQPTDVSSDGRP